MIHNLYRLKQNQQIIIELNSLYSPQELKQPWPSEKTEPTAGPSKIPASHSHTMQPSLITNCGLFKTLR